MKPTIWDLRDTARRKARPGKTGWASYGTLTVAFYPDCKPYGRTDVWVRHDRVNWRDAAQELERLT